MTQLINSYILEHTDYTPEFIEGAILAANMTPKALDPTIWIEPLLELDKSIAQPLLVQHFEVQYAQLMTCEYDALQLLGFDGLVNNKIVDFAEGFMTVWSVIEPGWNEVDQLSDGTVRMLQGLLTTLMLTIDEQSTHQQMKEAGIEQPPTLVDMLPQLNLMINEVSKAANDALQGDQSVRVNPYKNIGRNDPCICNSGKKFKQCCGRS
ncbi:SEC-C metal-binding domain-containing protein [Vibrio rumoiensis]|uniref:Prepilin peptidase n=1 Tax=Vibrio rumoiensis 1S-45 TaxID=1188252 RepID=A0A1E5E3N9_9VIBR|nr:SEC-C metal-binding domain-containing protein [Vibrio rumoiensis]OEF26950.1 prepilin peptidase [Vibrio rumoiensis 1S-45]